MVLQGCTQSAEDFARGTRMNKLAEAIGFLVTHPEQARAANSQKCWKWFRPGDQVKGSGVPAFIAGIAGEIAARHSVDRARIYVAGLSAGGAATTIMAQAYSRWRKKLIAQICFRLNGRFGPILAPKFQGTQLCLAGRIASKSFSFPTAEMTKADVRLEDQ